MPQKETGILSSIIAHCSSVRWIIFTIAPEYYDFMPVFNCKLNLTIMKLKLVKWLAQIVEHPSVLIFAFFTSFAFAHSCYM